MLAVAGGPAWSVLNLSISMHECASWCRSIYLMGSFLQEIAEKAPQMPDDVQWHFIGHLQSNKVKNLIGDLQRYLPCSLQSVGIAALLFFAAFPFSDSICCTLHAEEVPNLAVLETVDSEKVPWPSSLLAFSLTHTVFAHSSGPQSVVQSGKYICFCLQMSSSQGSTAVNDSKAASERLLCSAASKQAVYCCAGARTAAVEGVCASQHQRRGDQIWSRARQGPGIGAAHF